VDVVNSPFDLDLSTRLPFPDNCFGAIVGQQVVEHLDMQSELLPLMQEIYRVSKHDAEIWLSTPDMEKVCHAYLLDKGTALREDRLSRHNDPELGEQVPSQHTINVLFHQGAEHKNLFDFDLLSWVLEQSGFCEFVRTSEAEFLARYPEFPPRGDDLVSLYMRGLAMKPHAQYVNG
jgi:predicted SAM-dependent methyltransferase